MKNGVLNFPHLFLIRLYLLFYKVTSVIFRLIFDIFLLFRSILEGIWLGILSRKTLNALTIYFYNNAGQYKNDQWNKETFFPWEKHIIENYFNDSKKLLVLGAGGGREVLLLLKSGYQVSGYECSKKLVDYSNKLLEKEGYHSCIRYVDVDKCPNLKEKFDGIILGWGAYSHISGRQTRIKLLAELRDNMIHHSPLMVSFWPTDHYSVHMKIKLWTARLFSTIRMGRKVELGEEISNYFGRYFTKEEIESELNEAGFEIQYYDNKGYGNIAAFPINSET